MPATAGGAPGAGAAEEEAPRSTVPVSRMTYNAPAGPAATPAPTASLSRIHWPSRQRWIWKPPVAGVVETISTLPSGPIAMSFALPGRRSQLVPFQRQIWLPWFATHGLPEGSTAIRKPPPPIGRQLLPSHLEGLPFGSRIQTSPLAPIPMSMAFPGMSCQDVSIHRKMEPDELTTQALPFGSTATRTACPTIFSKALPSHR